MGSYGSRGRSGGSRPYNRRYLSGSEGRTGIYPEAQRIYRYLTPGYSMGSYGEQLEAAGMLPGAQFGAGGAPGQMYAGGSQGFDPRGGGQMLGAKGPAGIAQPGGGIPGQPDFVNQAATSAVRPLFEQYRDQTAPGINMNALMAGQGRGDPRTQIERGIAQRGLFNAASDILADPRFVGYAQGMAGLPFAQLQAYSDLIGPPAMAGRGRGQDWQIGPSSVSL